MRALSVERLASAEEGEPTMVATCRCVARRATSIVARVLRSSRLSHANAKEDDAFVTSQQRQVLSPPYLSGLTLTLNSNTRQQLGWPTVKLRPKLQTRHLTTNHSRSIFSFDILPFFPFTSHIPSPSYSLTMASTTSPEPTDGSTENPYIQSLVKNMRAINKKITSMAKTDAVIKENPTLSLDELVAQRKINQDQKASALKKPQLQAQLVALEEQVQQYKKFDSEFRAQLQKQKEDLTSTHGEELERIKREAQAEAVAQREAEFKKKLLVFSQFLRAAAARRNGEEDEEADENRAFEGTLLLLYGGDEKAVETALNLIEGSDEQVTSIEGSVLPVKCELCSLPLDAA